MVNEVIDCFDLSDEKVIVDGTLGLGGYTEKLLRQAELGVKVIAFELDQENLAQAKERLAEFGDRVIFINDNFANLEEALHKVGYSEIDGLMLDLGLSSPQIDNAEKGFSFMREGPLDMRFDQSQGMSAAEVLNQYSEQKLAQIFKDYGEERFAKKIAAAIVKDRASAPFQTTTQLASMIERLIKGPKGRIHPATKVFQALRIEVNHELDSLVRVLNQALKMLKKGGRIVVVSYHSLEDRVVKMFFRDQAREYVNLPNELTTTKLQPQLEILSKKPLIPSDEEIAANPRARSAKLRFAQKL